MKIGGLGNICTIKGRKDTQHNDAQHNDIQHNDTQQNDDLHKCRSG